MKNLFWILSVFMLATSSVYAASSAVSTATITAANTAAMYHVMHSHSNRSATTEGISKVFRNETISKSDIVVPCEVFWISEGIFKKDVRVDVEKTLKKCDEEKSIIEQMNDVKYSFGKAKTYDPYFGKVYMELIENEKK